MDFCLICDGPLPAAMLCEGICECCWRQHAKLDLAGEPMLAHWAECNANRARGSLLLAAEASS
jgi:hypothetical protein